ncbi:Nudix family hydrolase [Marinobacter salinisoli]|uniref:8-oxo-dGTP diphosphatase n=1 Tax=Marinobacter salinisoli TaxID=2769486 RepID=A0ABX7MUX1_9GAMM|nr:Nudix family hydrolase [Marinobacter salinisoli]QSP96177.1 Nudix family hydrolase [Marinobacter salinisoli]
MSEAGAAKREVHVAVAVIERDGRVLIARRPDHAHQGGLLEFPGGKVEPGETVQQALVREIAEETALVVPEVSLEPVIGIRHDYGDKRVFLDVWRTCEAQGAPQGCEGQPIDWIRPEQLQDEDFPAANRPIIRAVRLPSLLAISPSLSSVREYAGGFAGALGQCRPELLVLRAPELEDGDYRALLESVLPVCRAAGVGLIVHGGPDRFAVAPGVAGLHLPWREAELLGCRPVPADVWLGVSCHSAKQIAQAEKLGADYVTLGPVRPTPTHPEARGIGWDEFEQITAQARVPVFALGGLVAADVPRARRAGGQGVAGIRFWWPGD